MGTKFPASAFNALSEKISVFEFWVTRIQGAFLNDQNLYAKL